jgi:hypothetical protein
VNDEIEGTADVNDVTERELPQVPQQLPAGVDVNALLLPLEDGDAINENIADSVDKLKARKAQSSSFYRICGNANFVCSVMSTTLVPLSWTKT